MSILTLRQARRLADKTQEQMADALGMAKPTYLKIEKNPNTATIEQAIKISTILGIPYDEIFFARKSNQ